LDQARDAPRLLQQPVHEQPTQLILGFRKRVLVAGVEVEVAEDGEAEGGRGRRGKAGGGARGLEEGAAQGRGAPWGDRERRRAAGGPHPSRRVWQPRGPLSTPSRLPLSVVTMFAMTTLVSPARAPAVARGA
jgi:hypothetical protein